MKFHVFRNQAGGDGGAGGGGGGDGAGAGAAGAGGGNGDAAAAAAAAAAADAAKAAASAVPEKYEFAKVKVTVDGKEVEQDVDAALAAEVSAFAKENKLTQEQAQAYMNRELALANAAQAAQAAEIKNLQTKWREEARAIPEIGGVGGADFDKNVAVGKKALETFFPELAKDANTYPFLDHPQVLKGLIAIGKKISADGEFIRGQGTPPATDASAVFYPSMRK